MDMITDDRGTLREVSRREGMAVEEIISLIEKAKPAGCGMIEAVQVFLNGYYSAALKAEASDA